MARIKRGIISRRKHKKILKKVSGYRMTKSRLIKVATEAVLHAGKYAYVGRKNRKRDFRRLWITRITQALKPEGINYSRFMHNLKEKNILLNRKMLSDMLLNDPQGFKQIVHQAKV